MEDVMVKKQGPPIHSADDKPLSVGQTVYGVDECDGSLTAVKVIDIDTGVKRQVRMRKKNGVEWLWSANASREMCRNREHFVFVEKARAEKHAKVCKAKRLSVTSRTESLSKPARTLSTQRII